MIDRIDPGSIGEVVTGLRRIRELNFDINNQPYASDAEAERFHVSRQVSDAALRRTVSLAKRDGAPEDAIERFYLLNPDVIQISPRLRSKLALAARAQNLGRTYDGAPWYGKPTAKPASYHPEDFFRFPRNLDGTVVGVDAPRASLVLKANGIRKVLLDRYWAQIIDPEGEQVVDIS